MKEALSPEFPWTIASVPVGFRCFQSTEVEILFANDSPEESALITRAV